MIDWPPNYTLIFMTRAQRLEAMNNDPSLAAGAFVYYKDRPDEFIMDWCVTYDPRNAGTDKPTIMPFQLFPRQVDLVEFIHGCIKDQENGLIEKCRDMGASWVCCGISVWLWLFMEGAAVGWGSRKEEYVDKKGDPKAIFPKIRQIINNLPKFFRPVGYIEDVHATHMKIINPQNGANITGEAGDNIGRGGRTLIYFKDESAHYLRPALIEAALGDNTNVQIDISSVNGTANIFYTRRQAGVEWEKGKEIQKGKTRVFIMDWRDHPNKTQEWYDRRKAKAESEGLGHMFAQEVDRDYSAAVQGVVIPAKWVRAAIDAHKKLGIKPEGLVYAALDVADEGSDANALTARQGIIPLHCSSWPEGDTTETADKAILYCSENRVDSLQYDCIGVGAGVKAEFNTLKKNNKIPKYLKIEKWDASAPPEKPDQNVIPHDKESKLNKDFYENVKAQGWWSVRGRFEKTYKTLMGIKEYPPEELISIPSDFENRHQLENELSQPTITTSKKGKLMIDKKPDGARSPNLADSFVMCYFPVEKQKGFMFV